MIDRRRARLTATIACLALPNTTIAETKDNLKLRRVVPRKVMTFSGVQVYACYIPTIFDKKMRSKSRVGDQHAPLSNQKIPRLLRRRCPAQHTQKQNYKLAKTHPTIICVNTHTMLVISRKQTKPLLPLPFPHALQPKWLQACITFPWASRALLAA